MRTSLPVIFLAFAAVTFAACKGDPEKCDRACRNYAQLVFWDDANAKIAAAPADQRDALRRETTSKFAVDLEHGIDFCVSRCVSANYDKDVDCWLAAKTGTQAKACADN
jgi:hypothetical protein